ncbi:uncharacterized protein LOC142336005 [Convolutriloba macropyga]|uniref:uncharacterized protein LOC142336005 n=1 Tax=Convolutriloba macropyga TaxID=536237 RepID=UPI003F522E02
MTAGGGGATKSDNPVQIFGNVFISFIGAGVLGLPYAFKEAGFLEGILIMSMVAVLSTKAMLMLISCKDRVVEMVNNGNGAMNEVWPNRTSNIKVSSANSSPSRQASNQKIDNTAKKSINAKKQYALLALSSSSEDDGDGYGSDYELVAIKKPTKKIVYYESYHHLKNKDLDYADVAEFTLGYCGKLIVELSLVVSQTGFCCAYLIFIQENLTDFVPSIQQITWLLGLLPILTGLCFYRNLNSLSLFSILADFANVFAYLIVFYFDFSQHHTVSKHPKYLTVAGFPFFLGIALYCYEGAGMILALEASVVPSARHLFKGIFKLVMCIVTTLYIVFGAAGYLSFGRETQPIITLNLPDSLFPHLVKVCLCFSLVFTYPMMMFPVVQLLESKFLPEYSSLSNSTSSPTSSTDTSDNLRNPQLTTQQLGSLKYSNATSKYMPGNMLRCGLVCVTGLIVVAIPNFSVLMALVGSTCCTLLAFILPAVFHLYLFQDESSVSQLTLDYVLIFIGVLGALMGTWDAICRLIPSLSVLAIFHSAKETILSFIH